MVMKNELILLFLVFCSITSAQIINFPDANFKNALVNTKCVDSDNNNSIDSDADLNNDGEIDVSEAVKVNTLSIDSLSISSLAGIENFKYLKHLDCSFNKLTSLDVQILTNMESLVCGSNQLTSLNVQGLTNMITLSCGSNQLTSLNVQGLTNVITLSCGSNQLASLNVQGLTNLRFFNCSSNQLTSLNAQGLTNVINLYCNSNQLTSLNVQGLINLRNLVSSRNQLTSLDVNALTNLVSLDCYSNQLTSLNVQGLTNLEDLSCGSNQLTSLNVQGLTNVITLYCYSNQLTSLDVNGLTNLELFSCGSNQLTSLDVQGLTNVKSLDCYSNQLISLNVQGLINLRYLDCSRNQLTSLNIKGTNLKGNEHFFENRSLIYICCNEQRIKDIKNKTLSNGQHNCEVNSYCSFTPGGKFYILDGENAFDENNNGCDDLAIKLPYSKYNITTGNKSGTFISNSNGKYSIPLPDGTHTITPILEYPAHFEITPSSYTVAFPNTSDTITQNFCITPRGIYRQINIIVIPLSPPARPGFDAKYKIVSENVGNQVESGTLNFTYDETRLDYISATQTADLVADGIVKWNFTNLLPFEKREITVTLKVNRPTDTPAVNAGDKLYLRASILDNIFTLENTIAGSYDPNDKTCLQGDRIKTDMIGKYVDYLIRFENTGNYAAENVVVKDIIDIKRFDVSSLQITDASHEVYTRIDGNKVEFIFENIQLPFDDANNDGYIAFKIKTLPTLGLGDSLKNMADIYFDYNFPIRTNEAKTSITWSKGTTDNTANINIIPNPVGNILYLQTDEKWTKAEIFDISGRIMRSVTLDSQSIDVDSLESGTYFIRLRNGEKFGRVKFVKM